MFGRILINTEDWIVSVGLTGKFKVTLKGRNVTKKASKEEAHHFQRVVACMSDLGIPIEPNSEPFEFAAEDFAEAIFSCGGAKWKVYFSTFPHEIANRYVDEIE